MNREFVGSLQYMSMAATMCMQYSPTDDLYEIGYMLLHLLHGSLPWDNYVFGNLEQRQKILKVTQVKAQITHEVSKIYIGIEYWR